MFPQLLIGKIAISSYGVFLTVGFLLGVFLIWRLSRAWDLDEEKVLDLTILTFLGGLLGARLYFVLENLPSFSHNLLNIILINKVAGFSFWGGLIGGFLTLRFFAKREKVDFLQVGDIASVGFLAGLILSNLGCFFAGCSIGIESKVFFAVNMVGILGKRFPTQLLESGLFFIIFLKLWSSSAHFHQRGKILSLSLIYIGLVKLLMEPLHSSHNEGIFLSVLLVILGINIFYKVTKRNLKKDLKTSINFLYKLFTDPLTRKFTLVRFQKYWYNQTTHFSWSFRNFKKNLRRLNVRISYKNNKLY